MKKLIVQATVGLLIGGITLSAVAGGPEMAPAPVITPGLYFGLGGSAGSQTLQRQYAVEQVTQPGFVSTNNGTTGNHNSFDQISQTYFNMAPVVQAGYWGTFDNQWLWGIQALYKYLNFTTNTEKDGLPIALARTFTSMVTSVSLITGSSATSFTSYNNELLLLAYGGKQFETGYVYIGFGPVMWQVRDFVGGVTSASTATTSGGGPATVTNGTQNWAFATLKSTRQLWGGAFQIGYNYFFEPTWFLNVNYTYSLSGIFRNSTLLSPSQFAQLPNSFTSTTGGTVNTVTFQDTTVAITRRIQIENQELMFSFNKVFAI